MAKAEITSSSTAEYFAKNLQQVGFSSPAKAVLTTLKEAVDNALDACEEEGILPDVRITVEKAGKGSGKNTDLVEIIVEDNGPGIEENNLSKVYGEYLASSKFGRGRCSRGQQGIGISAATTWAQLTNATGVRVMTKTARQRKAVSAIIDVDIKSNKGLVKQKETVEWDRPHGTRVEFRLDGRVQLNGDAGIMTYIEGTTLVNPHMTIHYKLPDQDWVTVERVTNETPSVPPATLPHPHTMKLGEFIAHASLYGKVTFSNFLKSGFSRVTDGTISDFVKNGMPKSYSQQPIAKFNENDFKTAFQIIQSTPLQSPSTRSVLTIGEESLAKSIQRLGEVDFFSVVTRKPQICDFKPVVVEVALARFISRGEADSPVQVLRFANRVPLQFDKGACAITKAIESVNWRAYGLNQAKASVPSGPYVFAVSVTSPFIKFKNASKETIDASDELVEEIRLALMRAGQKLSRHIKRETKEADLERKLAHIESFGPILVECLVRLTKAPAERKKRAEDGLKKLLGRDTREAEKDLEMAHEKLETLKARQREKGIYLAEGEGDEFNEEGAEPYSEIEEHEALVAAEKQSTTKQALNKQRTGKQATVKQTTGKQTSGKASTQKAATQKQATGKTTTGKVATKKATTKK